MSEGEEALTEFLFKSSCPPHPSTDARHRARHHSRLRTPTTVRHQSSPPAHLAQHVRARTPLQRHGHAPTCVGRGPAVDGVRPRGCSRRRLARPPTSAGTTADTTPRATPPLLPPRRHRRRHPRSRTRCSGRGDGAPRHSPPPPLQSHRSPPRHLTAARHRSPATPRLERHGRHFNGTGMLPPASGGAWW